MAWSADGLFLATASTDRTVRLFDRERGEAQVFHAPETLISLAWSADDRLLVPRISLERYGTGAALERHVLL